MLSIIKRVLIKTKTLETLDRLLIKKPFCIASNNCWGYKLYNILKREYNTPFIGLYIVPSDFNKVCRDLVGYLNKGLSSESFIDSKESFPVAKIGDVKIYFMHYESREDAIDKWNRRSERMLSFIADHGIESVTFKICQRDGTATDIDEFRNLNLNKSISFTRSDNKLILKNGDIPPGDELFDYRFMYYIKYINLFNR